MPQSVYFESFCGDSIFWDYDLTWNTTKPQLTRCFHQTILNWIPSLFLWIFSFFELYRIIQIKNKAIPRSYFNAIRIILGFLCVPINVVQLLNILQREYSSDETPLIADIFSPLLDITSFTLVTLFLYYHRLRGVHTSPIIWIYLFLKVLCTLLICYSIFIGQSEYTLFESILYNIYLIVILALLVINSFADGPVVTIETHHVPHTVRETYGKPSPENGASFLSQITFSWFGEMAKLGWKRALTATDLWELPNELKTRSLTPKFEEHLEKLKKTPERNNPRTSVGGNAQVPRASGSKQASKSHIKVNIVPILAKIFGTYFIAGSACKLIHDLCQFIVPQLLRSLINFIDNGIQEPIWHGFLIALAMFIVSTIQSLFLNHYFERMFITGMNINSVLTAAIYKKSLNLSDQSRKDVTSGEIVNLMAVDSKRFLEMIPYINLIWSVPLQIALAIYFLYLELGYSALVGLGVMVLTLPLNALVASLSKKFEIQLMKQKDERVNFINEILAGIKIVKFYAWEESFLKHVTQFRERELQYLRKISYLGCLANFFWTSSPIMVAVVTFAVHVLIQGEVMTAQKAFVSLALFDVLRFPLSMLPYMMNLYIMASVSVKRINKFLSYDELDPYVSRKDGIDAITVEKGAFNWATRRETETKDSNGQKQIAKAEKNAKGNADDCLVLEARSTGPALSGISMNVKAGSFVAIVGSVGSGKSSLLSAILGEMERIKGRVNINSKMSIAYVSQQAWIQNSTLKDNILFGKAHDKVKYDRVVAACALAPDIAYLPGGDETEIGEKGINLSGGQKQRVSLARACYADSDIYIMDDPLSAVDAHVAKHIFDKVLSSTTGLLRAKTRVLVTNKLDILSKVDKIIVLKKGRITELGPYMDLMKSGGEFCELIKQFTNQDLETSDDFESSAKETVVRRESSIKLQRQLSTVAEEAVIETKLIETEIAETGGVKMQVYVEYFKMMSFLWASILVLGYAASEGFGLSADIWLSKWSGDQRNGETSSDNTRLRLGVYGSLGILQALLMIIGSLAMVFGTLRACSRFHRDLLLRILRSPMSFFDTTPAGRIVNRFSKDMDTIDSLLPENISVWFICLFKVLATFVVICLKTPYSLLALIPIMTVYGFFQRVYVASSRQLKRLESISRSPIYSHFGETLNGVNTIRAFNVSERFIAESADKVDFNLSCYYPSVIANRWLAIRLDVCGNLIILFAATFAVLARKTLGAGDVGLSVTYALGATSSLNWLVRMSSDIETNIVSVERVLEYCRLPGEADWFTGKVSPKDTWPQDGAIRFDRYQTRYREGTELVLKDISADIKPREKVGIVGRTGAGKSTITLSLFRLIEPVGGSIHIDGYNISDLPLNPLRSRLAIIPQDPVLFSGSLRFNLDPFNRYSDEEIWNSLDHAHLREFVQSLGEGLGYTIAEEGSNLSVGQRQLLCLSRALLKRPKILVLDEATAAIDLETDSIIQTTIRSEFSHCTILTIAHRLNTIMDSDRVLVLDRGKVAEFDSPSNLLGRKDTIFYSLAKEANLVA